MIQYIYFLKCPNCEDEPFDFFDEAKASALGCLSSKPIITQVEVNRNDFGECTDSKDLGTIWSWEDEVDTVADEPAVSVFTKGDFAKYDPDHDEEFAALDNSVDFEPVDNTEFHSDDSLDKAPDNFRKPIPDGMTIKELVEAMEENEDTVECVCCDELYPKEDCKYDEKHGWICPDCADEVVECTWCEELYDRSECRYEVDLGWLCDRCEAAIKSRGETLTFRESNYWDFLDEDCAEEPLDEAFKHLAGLEDVKQKLLDMMVTIEPRASRFIKDGTISVPYIIRHPSSASGTANVGYITDFDVLSDGSISVSYTRYGHSGYDDLEYLLSSSVPRSKSCITYTALKTLKEAAKELNKQSNPGITAVRDANVFGKLTENPEVAEEFKTHIKKIEYRIPLLDDFGDDFYEDKVHEPLTPEAQNKLETIYNTFYKLDFADAARDAGMVKNRPSTEDTNHNIEKSWAAVGIITFDCPIKELSSEAQNMIKVAKVKKADDSSAASETSHTTSCYRLANALIKYFNNDVLFFQKITESVVKDAKSFLEELEDADTYSTRLVQCPECGKTAFDPETEICGNCGFNTFLKIE